MLEGYNSKTQRSRTGGTTSKVEVRTMDNRTDGLSRIGQPMDIIQSQQSFSRLKAAAAKSTGYERSVKNQPPGRNAKGKLSQIDAMQTRTKEKLKRIVDSKTEDYASQN